MTRHTRRPVTALPAPTPTSTFTDFDGFAAEYVSAAENLASSLPEGVEFPAAPPGAWEVDGTFEEGTGEIAAAVEWRCECSSAYVITADSGLRGTCSRPRIGGSVSMPPSTMMYS